VRQIGARATLGRIAGSWVYARWLERSRARVVCFRRDNGVTRCGSRSGIARSGIAVAGVRKDRLSGRCRGWHGSPTETYRRIWAAGLVEITPPRSVRPPDALTGIGDVRSARRCRCAATPSAMVDALWHGWSFSNV
jgi:hypothetical protein